ncbi:hypothetical protein SEPCBS119000_001952 [Sporothrix epigloea]|uniref:Uncharacterized protein n=1 Tax=Sporothrix epigloea TaxID=1892477 RepID=A0ABP0DES4_9PEZI
MGAEQSSHRGAEAPVATATQKTCYYELLSVTRTATDDEIKKAYRRKALELHPDRNLDDTANATRKFAEVQTAYEILSDAQERAWYDSHRDAILRGDNTTDGGADVDNVGPRFYNNVRLTPTEDLFSLMGRFNSSVPFNDSPMGFFGILEATFAQLGLEEEAAFSWDGHGDGGAQPPQYPPFGSANDDYDAVGKPFYRDWSNFATIKSFSWKDKYRLADAPDRAIRRIMEKENKKAREMAAREFNDAVRSLVAFVRKRDPRYVANTQSEAERQQTLRESATAQAARQRAANQERRAAAVANMEESIPLWARVVGDDGEPLTGSADDNGLNGEFSSEAESEVQHEIECVVCDKSFKSEKQFEAHEKSKKHVKAVHQLRRQMKRDNRDLHIPDTPLTALEPAPAAKDEEDDLLSGDDETFGDTETPASAIVTPDQNQKPAPQPTGDESEKDSSSEENDEYAPKEVVMKRFQNQANDASDSDSGDENGLAAKINGLDVEDDKAAVPAKVKVGKARAKREKKAARWAAQQEQGATCQICDEHFDSNTKLHKHLRDDHPPETNSRSERGGKKKKKR